MNKRFFFYPVLIVYNYSVIKDNPCSITRLALLTLIEDHLCLYERHFFGLSIVHILIILEV